LAFSVPNFAEPTAFVSTDAPHRLSDFEIGCPKKSTKLGLARRPYPFLRWRTVLKQSGTAPEVVARPPVES
jgi:hypothetical protein